IKLLNNIPNNCKAILTSQRIIDENQKNIKVDFMSKQESIELIREIGIKDESVFDEIIHFTGGHPLCLLLIAGQAIISGKDLSNILKDIKKAKDSVIDHVINSSIKLALKDGRRILSVLSIFDKTLSRKALQEICQLDEESFNKALNNLLKLSLIESYQSGKRFYLHSEIRQKAKALLAKDPYSSKYYERAAIFFRDFARATVPMTDLITATQALQLQMPAGTSKEQIQSAAMELIVNPAKQMLEIELYNCLNMLEWAITNRIDIALDMLNMLGNAICSHSYLNKVAEYYNRIIEKLDDKQRQMVAYNNLAVLYQTQGKFDEAITNYEKALNLAQELQAKEFEAEILNSLGLISRQMQKIEKSIEYFEMLRDLLKDLGEIMEYAETIFTLGILNQNLGKDETAIDCFKSAYNIFKENNDKQGIANVLIHKAEYYKKDDQLDSAISCYQEALDIYNDLNEVDGQAFVSMALGEIYQKQGDMEKAIISYQNSLKFAKREVRQKIMDNMAKIYCMHKQWAKSADACSESFQISIQLQPGIILNSIRNMLEIVKVMFEAGEFAIPAQLAYNLSQIIKDCQIHDEEIRAALAISHGVFTVIGFVAVSENEKSNTMYEEAIELARNLDESTGNMLNLSSYFERR
ncbi:MAG: tetratricopeptide repeat protein, partial [bacterium]